MGSPSRNMFADALGASPHMYHGHSIFNSPMARNSPMALGLGMGGVGMGLSGRTPDLAEGGWWTDNPFATNCMELYGNEGKSIYDDL